MLVIGSLIDGLIIGLITVMLIAALLAVLTADIWGQERGLTMAEVRRQEREVAVRRHPSAHRRSATPAEMPKAA